MIRCLDSCRVAVVAGTVSETNLDIVSAWRELGPRRGGPVAGREPRAVAPGRRRARPARRPPHARRRRACLLELLSSAGAASRCSTRRPLSCTRTTSSAPPARWPRPVSPTPRRSTSRRVAQRPSVATARSSSSPASEAGAPTSSAAIRGASCGPRSTRSASGRGSDGTARSSSRLSRRWATTCAYSSPEAGSSAPSPASPHQTSGARTYRCRHERSDSADEPWGDPDRAVSRGRAEDGRQFRGPGPEGLLRRHRRSTA